MGQTSYPDETRLTLLRRVRDQADAASWSEFVALYEPLLLSYVLDRGLPHSDARDVVQDIFVKLFRTLPKFELDHKRGRFRTWLWQVTSTTIVDWARRRKRQARLEEAARQRISALEANPEEPDAEWETAYQQRIMNHALDQVRGATQPKTWTCFEQHILRGRSSAEVGAELGLTANSVNVNASRVLARVRQLCAYYRDDADET